MEKVGNVGHGHRYKCGSGKPVIKTDEGKLPQFCYEEIEKGGCGKNEAGPQEHLSPAYPVREQAYRHTEDNPGEGRDSSNAANGCRLCPEIGCEEWKNRAFGDGRAEYGAQAGAAKKEKRAHGSEY
jgi:hypothetical protein